MCYIYTNTLNSWLSTSGIIDLARMGSVRRGLELGTESIGKCAYKGEKSVCTEEEEWREGIDNMPKTIERVCLSFHQPGH